jgi:7-cyano-7-deazaguanine reductase
MPEFTAICPFSDFPDFAVIRLKYVPNERCIELKSLKLYINSFREIKIFHEHVINVILDDFVAACDPLRVEIEGDFHVRGNIKTVVRTKYKKEADIPFQQAATNLG